MLINFSNHHRPTNENSINARSIEQRISYVEVYFHKNTKKFHVFTVFDDDLNYIHSSDQPHFVLQSIADLLRPINS